MAKLIDREGELAALPAEPKPFALVTVAHLITRRTRDAPYDRLVAKRRRFGPLSAAVTDRLVKAAPDQLERWAERVLDAATLDDVFAES
ncbi:hypothetical protein [Thauera sp. 2A1]|uniref:hypothetical protein n=1 Tax=Thauera sp. 2A1 TaxID=2570191 RepID=UPI00129246D0|nr:hypothetical protein [Thauera sp. 2A1]KAI5915489.1 DUF4351 domain-containing protein [Thauera sp. 2A1]